jgi:hypothetical protein
MTGSSAERGRRLEHDVGAFFHRNGYVVRLNQVMQGRSGGRHEIDVLAEKSDALTNFRVAIECKAWGSPIEKDVVSKLHYVMGDLGIHKGIVVSLAGARSGAETAARELGIELWGRDELRRHLGEAVFTDIAGTMPKGGPEGTAGYGYPFRTSSEAAEQLIRSAGKGRLGLRTLEAVVWFAPLWVPTYAIRLTVAQPQVKRLRTRLTSSVVDNTYEAISGEFIGQVAPGVSEVQLGTVRALKPLRRDVQVHGDIRRAMEARVRVSSPAAVQRHENTLRGLGVPTPCQSVSIDNTSVVFLPVFAGALQASGADRIVAVSGFSGTISERLSRILTANLAHVRQSFSG